jgi:hypothetical protein
MCLVVTGDRVHVGEADRSLTMVPICGDLKAFEEGYEGWYPASRKLVDAIVPDAKLLERTVCDDCARSLVASRAAKEARDRYYMIRAYRAQFHVSMGMVPKGGGEFYAACGKRVFPDKQEIYTYEQVMDGKNVCHACRRSVERAEVEESLSEA